MNIDLDPNKPVYLITVPHTGTHSARMMLDSMAIWYRQTHFQQIHEIAIDRILDENNVITTYRDPFLCAASWANWDKISRRQAVRRFKGNWTRWGLMVPHAVKVIAMDEMNFHANKNHRGDVTGAIAAYMNNDWDRYFEIVPKELANHAAEIAHKAGYYACS